MKYLLLTPQLLMRACLGMIFLILLFVISVITVLGVKSLTTIIKDKFYTKPAPPPPVEKPKRTRKVVKSIQIDPSEDTRIIFKKSS